MKCSVPVIASIAAVTLVALVPMLNSAPSGQIVGPASKDGNDGAAGGRINARGVSAGRWPQRAVAELPPESNAWEVTPSRCRDPGLPSVPVPSVVNVTYPRIRTGSGNTDDGKRWIACYNATIDLVCGTVMQQGVWEKRFTDILLHAMRTLKTMRIVERKRLMSPEGLRHYDPQLYLDEIEYVDIGANVGALAFQIHLAGFDVTAFEAMPTNAQLLSVSKCLNHLRPMMVQPVKATFRDRLNKLQALEAKLDPAERDDDDRHFGMEGVSGMSNASSRTNKNNSAWFAAKQRRALRLTRFKFNKRDRFLALFNGGVAFSPEELAWTRAVTPTPHDRAKFLIVNAALGNSTTKTDNDRRRDRGDDVDGSEAVGRKLQKTGFNPAASSSISRSLCTLVSEKFNFGDAMLICNNETRLNELLARGYEKRATVPLATLDSFLGLWNHTVGSHPRRRGSVNKQATPSPPQQRPAAGGNDELATSAASSSSSAPARRMSGDEVAAAVGKRRLLAATTAAVSPPPLSLRSPTAHAATTRLAKQLSADELESSFAPKGYGVGRGGNASWAAFPIDVNTRDYIVKLDVEGFEPQILAGARHFLSNPRTRPKLMLCEVWIGVNITEFLTHMMTTYGYRVYHPEGFYWIDKPAHATEFHQLLIQTKWKVVDVIVFVLPGYELLLPDEDQQPALSSHLRKYSDRFAVGYYQRH